MASSYSVNLNLQEPATGDLVNAWGPIVNSNMTVVDATLGSSTSIALTNANVTLTVAQSAYHRIILTGTLTANVELILPATIGGSRYIWNTTTGAYTVTVLNGASDTGGGVICPQGLLCPVVLTAGQAYYDNYQAVPPGTILHYGGVAAPPGFLFTYGQTLSTTTYAGLFAAIAYTYGGSGGSFILPDTRGRVLAAPDNMGGTAANVLVGYVLGTTGGLQNVTLSSSQMPSHTHTATVNDPTHNHGLSTASTFAATGAAVAVTGGGSATNTASASTNISVTNASTGGGTSHPNVQPTLGINHIIRF